ncbi:type IV secretion protein Rhs, partial [Pseudomonas syringae]
RRAVLEAGVCVSLVTAGGGAMGGRMPAPSGAVITASLKVYITNRKAAHVEKSIGACDRHPGPIRIAEGATNVFINSVAAARKGDKLTCGAAISSGSNNVFIGGGRYRYLTVDEEIPGRLRPTVAVLSAAGGAAGRSAQLIQAGRQMGLKSVRT